MDAASPFAMIRRWKFSPGADARFSARFIQPRASSAFHHDLDRTMGARGHGGRDAAEHKALDPAHSPRADEDAIGAPDFRLGYQQSLRLLHFYYHVGLQTGGGELSNRFVNHLFDSGLLFVEPGDDWADHTMGGKLWRRPRGVDNAGFTAGGPFARGDGFDCGLSAFRAVDADNQPDRRTRFLDTASSHAHRAARLVQDLLRDAAEKEPSERRVAVRPDDDQVGAPFVGLLDDHCGRRPRAGFGLHVPALLHRNQAYSAAPRQRQIFLIPVDVLYDLKPGRRRQPVLDDRQDFDLRVRGQTDTSQIIQRGVCALRAVVSDEDFHSIRHTFLLLFFRVWFLPYDLDGAMRMRGDGV